jgi:hypothetical protein
MGSRLTEKKGRKERKNERKKKNEKEKRIILKQNKLYVLFSCKLRIQKENIQPE